MKSRHKGRLVAIALPFLLAPAVGQATPHTIAFHRLELTVSDSQTAQLFHIVDQLSQWDPFTHRQYARWAAKSLPLDDDDRRVLQQHVELRRRHGWGGALEQAFLVDQPLDAAARDAVRRGLLTEAEATTERDVLRHFAPRLAPLIDQQKPELDRFIRQLEADRDRLAPTIADLAAFCGVRTKISAPVFLAANPDARSGGGGANGDRLVVEVPAPDPRSTLLHETLHRLLVSHRDEIKAAADASGIPADVLSEGIAYAFAPGLTGDGSSDDILADAVVGMQLRGAKPTDSYMQYYSMALVIRPLLWTSIREHESFSTFLSKAVQRWKATAAK